MAGYGKARDLTLVERFVTSYGLAATVASSRCKKSGGVKTPPAREVKSPYALKEKRYVTKE